MTARARISFAGSQIAVAVDDQKREQQVRYLTRLLQPFRASANAPCRTELLECLLALYTVDRLVPRPRRGWTRDLEITLPVISLERWQAAQHDLKDLIEASTGDLVSFHFKPRNDADRNPDERAQVFELEPQRSVDVGLLSDGLDSLCGAAAALEGESQRRYELVSVITNSRRMARIAAVRDGLHRRYGDQFTTKSLDLSLIESPRRQEPTQRSRTLLAIAAGMTVAAAHGSKMLDVYENGIGILNLPVPDQQMPHHSSQVLHPANIDRWRRVTGHFFGPITLSYPNRWRTKAEMCAGLPRALRHLVRVTSSCDRPQRSESTANCGVCGSCAFRRIALQNAHMTCDDATYVARPPRLRDVDPADMLVFHADLLGEALDRSDPWPALIALQSTLATSIEGASDAAERAQMRQATIALLRRHVLDMNPLRTLSHAV